MKILINQFFPSCYFLSLMSTYFPQYFCSETPFLRLRDQVPLLCIFKLLVLRWDMEGKLNIASIF